MSRAIFVAVFAIAVYPSFAQSKTKPGPAASASLQTVTGTVKTTPASGGFVLSRRRGDPVTIDAKRASITFRGHAIKLSELPAGSVVSVTGKASGAALVASSLQIRSIPQDKKYPASLLKYSGKPEPLPAPGSGAGPGMKKPRGQPK